jgi:serine/threonine protein phosphatase PrpC
LPKYVLTKFRRIDASISASAFQQAFQGTILEIDTNLRESIYGRASENGCTFSGMLLTPHTIVAANLGDSRSVLWRDGAVLFESVDHKPSAEGETERIIRAGGYVRDNRVNGDLAVSRTIGDLMFKPSDAPIRFCPISPEPDVSVIPRRIIFEEENLRDSATKKSHSTLRRDVLLIATDGLWDVFTSEEVMVRIVGYVGDDALSVSSKMDTKAIAMRLSDALSSVIREAMLTRMSSDNITVIGFILDSNMKDEQVAEENVDGEARPSHTNSTGGGEEEAGLKENGSKTDEEEALVST